LQDVTGQVEKEESTEQFIASLSHEIRSPLNNVKMVIDILTSKRAGDLNKTQEEFLSIADKDVDIIIHTMDELNELVDLGSGKRRFEYQWANIQEPF